MYVHNHEYGKSDFCYQIHPGKLAGPLYTALGQSTGLAEPELITIFKYLLQVHTLWFASMGSNDRYNFYEFIVGITNIV